MTAVEFIRHIIDRWFAGASMAFVSRRPANQRGRGLWCSSSLCNLVPALTVKHAIPHPSHHEPSLKSTLPMHTCDEPDLSYRITLHRFRTVWVIDEPGSSDICQPLITSQQYERSLTAYDETTCQTSRVPTPSCHRRDCAICLSYDFVSCCAEHAAFVWQQMLARAPVPAFLGRYHA